MTGNPARWVYKTALWERMRQTQLRSEPLCRYCGQIGDITPATVVDHIKPHKGQRVLAFDQDNLQSLCKPCHDKWAQAKDNGKPIAGVDADGFPIDPNHPWNK